MEHYKEAIVDENIQQRVGFLFSRGQWKIWGYHEGTNWGKYLFVF